MTLIIVFMVVATILAVTLAIFAFSRRSASWELYFGFLILAAGEWTIGYLFEITTILAQDKIIWAKIEYIGIAIVPLAWFLFAVSYAGYDAKLPTNRIVALSVVPLTTIILAFTNEAHHLIWASIVPLELDNFTILETSYGGWFWLQSIYSYILLGSGTYFIGQTLYRFPKSFRRHGFILAIGAILPWISNASYILGFSPIPDIDLTPVAFVISGLLFFYAIFRFQLFRLIPVARRHAVDNMRQGMLVLDPDNLVVDVNPAGIELFGAPAAIIGKNAADFLPTSVLVRGINETEENIFFRAQEQSYYDVQISPLNDGARRERGRLLVFHDITELQLVASERAQRNRMLEALNELSHEISSTLDLQILLATVLRVSVEFLQVTSSYVNKWNVENQTITIIGEYYAESANEKERVSEAGVVYEVTTEFGISDFSHYRAGYRYLNYLDSPDSMNTPQEIAHVQKFGGNTTLEMLITIDNEIIGSLEVWESRHKRVFSEIEMDFAQSVAQQLGLAMKNAELYQQALAASRLKSGLLTRVSHELRTPLSVISLYAQILENKNSGELSVRQERAIEKISSNSEYLTLIVNNLLSQAALDADSLELEFKPFKPRKILNTVRERLSLLAQNSKCQLDVTIDPTLPETLVGDAKSVEQILSHLLHNGIKFTGEGAVSVGLNREDNNNWSIVVSDSGPGIDAEIQQFIYEPFRHGSLSPETEQVGIGIGLSIVKQLVNLMGGNLTLNSTVGQGSTFTATLPLIIDSQNDI